MTRRDTHTSTRMMRERDVTTARKLLRWRAIAALNAHYQAFRENSDVTREPMRGASRSRTDTRAGAKQTP
jgi:hypothetical protein